MSKYKAKEDKRQCRHCKSDISHKRSVAIYCDDTCRWGYIGQQNMKKVHTCAFCKGEFSGRKKKYCSKECKKEQRNENYRLENGLYDKYNKERKCKYCSKDISDKKLHAVYCDGRCADKFQYYETTTRMPVDEYRKMIAEQKEQREEKLKREQHQRYLERLTVKECEWCGNSYETDILNQKTCSQECRRKRRNQRSSLIKDERIPKSQIVDRDISLERLYKRDKGICYLCNEKCDYSDIKTTKDGYKYAGPTYPSTDHVMPVVHGGLHAWDNVRLAHHGCNSIKSDTIPDNLKELLPDDAYSVARKISPRMKTTLQFDLDGNLIATYDSTAQAERETGFKRRGIQNNARGETNTYKGYKWEYV